MGLVFLWDERKAASNLRKHRVAFTEAATIFADPLMIALPDLRHSSAEERFLSIGRTGHGRMIVVAHTESGNIIRIISARKATKNETRTYEQGEDF